MLKVERKRAHLLLAFHVVNRKNTKSIISNFLIEYAFLL